MNLASFFAILVAGVFIAICAFFIATRGPMPAGPGWSAEGLVTVILTATTVVLAALGIGIAIISIWGYDRILAETKKIAELKSAEIATLVALERTNAIVPRIIEARLQGDEGTKDSADEMAKAFSRDNVNEGDGNGTE